MFFLGLNCIGTVDYGFGDSSDELATHALVFMVVALNGTFKLPIAHFFTTGIGAQGKMLNNRELTMWSYRYIFKSPVRFCYP
jgi:hypothetical protein